MAISSRSHGDEELNLSHCFLSFHIDVDKFSQIGFIIVFGSYVTNDIDFKSLSTWRSSH